MPFGIASALGHFQWCMVTILHDMYGKIVAVYVDYLIVYGHDWRSCWGNTLTVLQTITKAGLAIDVGKAFLCRARAKVLGHVIDGTEGVMTPNPSTLKPLLNFEPPKLLVQLQSLFGQLNFFRVYCPHFELLVKPIKVLLHQSFNRVWTA